MFRLCAALVLCAAAAGGAARANPIRVPSDGVPAFEVDVPSDMQSLAERIDCLAIDPHDGVSLMELCMFDISGTPDDSVDQLGDRFMDAFGAGHPVKSGDASVDQHQGREFESGLLKNDTKLTITVVKLNRERAFFAARLQPAKTISLQGLALDSVLIKNVRLIGAD